MTRCGRKDGESPDPKGNAERAGQRPLACGDGGTRPGSSGRRWPCGEKSHPAERCAEPGGPAGCTPRTGESLVTGKGLDRQKKGEKQSF